MEQPAGDAEDQELMRMVNHTLYEGHPVEFLDLVSSIMAGAEEPRGPMGSSEERITLADLAETFEFVDLAATTALLHVFAAVSSDDVLVARIRRTLRERQQRLPAWVTRLSEVRIEQVVEMRHVLRDGENYFLDVRLPDGFAMTAVVYVDNNLGPVVKDGYTIDAPLDAVLEQARAAVDEDTSLEPVDPADARALMEAALEIEAIMFPPMESESWPACRPLLRWLVSLLPSGGRVPEETMPSDDELDAIADGFLASPEGRSFNDPDHAALLDVLVSLGATYDVQDPLRWSPVNVELLLLDRVPRKVVDRVQVLTKLPDLLRAFIRYAYRLRGLRTELLVETLESVDRWEPEYQRLIRTPRAQGAEALARMAMGLPTGLEAHDPWEQLVAAVGGEVELEL
ncbi:MAG TPA: hypothetical protein DEQ43_02160 [Nocardioides bacterium]|nr:hypothetical protein [Nocardioides sp.]